MKSSKLKLTITLLIFQIIGINAQSKIVDYLNVPGPINIDNKIYNLAWSSHPNQNYYKQEYLTSDEKIEKYNKMLLIEYVEGNYTLDQVVGQKVNELENMKKQNPIVNYKVYENNGEYILDFLLTENSKNGKEIKIAERNVYRYKLVSNDNKNGILLFAVSERAYENTLNDFFDNLKNRSSDLIESVGNYQIPNITVK